MSVILLPLQLCSHLLSATSQGMKLQAHFRRQDAFTSMFAVDLPSPWVQVFLSDQLLVPLNDLIDQRSLHAHHGSNVFKSAQAKGKVGQKKLQQK
jgi:hypothetical protein